MAVTTGKNIFLAVFLSLTLTVIAAAIYLLYPIVSMDIGLRMDPDTNMSRTFNVSSISVRQIGLIASILFLIIFALLQRRRVKQ